MEKSVQVFANEEFGKLVVIRINNEPWFLGSEVAKMLGYKYPSDAISEHCKYRKILKIGDMAILKIDQNVIDAFNLTPRGRAFINEKDIYRLIMHSELPSAEKFQDWVCDEVLPTIRKTGSYSIAPTFKLPDFTNPAESARAWADRFEGEQKALAKIKADEPKILLAESITASENGILVRDLAKILKQNGIDTGGHRLMGWMRDNKFLCKDGRSRNTPTQKGMDLGIFEVKEYVFGSVEKPISKFVTLVTGKGQLYFVNKFLSALRVLEVTA